MINYAVVFLAVYALVTPSAFAQDEDSAKSGGIHSERAGDPALPKQGKAEAGRILSELQAAGIPLRAESSYAPVSTEDDFNAVMKKMSADKAAVMQRQQQLLQSRYDLSDHAAPGVTPLLLHAVPIGE